jgi:hypothetical protein
MQDALAQVKTYNSTREINGLIQKKWLSRKHKGAYLLPIKQCNQLTGLVYYPEGY